MDKKHKKKLKRAVKKKKDRSQAEKQQRKLSNQMNMFDRLPDSCSACELKFPKTREAHMTWRVTVRNNEQQVRLFCPGCLETVSTVVEENNAIKQKAEEAT